jgi:hypothetical protein
MKKIFSIVLLSLLLFSCQQTEFEYSCDPVINKFILENKAEFSQISVTELATYEVALQKAVFLSWEPEKKRNAWLDKLNYILCSIPLSQAESAHIQKLINHLEVGYFLDENINNCDITRAKFASEWLNYASKDLGWSEHFIAFMVYRLYINQSQFDAELSALKAITIGTSTDSESGSCNCNTSTDYCSESACHSSGCSIGSGCGWLWSESCNGSCY